MTAWKLVPVEPTEEMMEAGQVHRGQWEAMLATAPNPDEATVERMARVICYWDGGPQNFDDEIAGIAVSATAKARYRETARAVLAALTETEQ